jgi:hypothetical protein
VSQSRGLPVAYGIAAGPGLVRHPAVNGDCAGVKKEVPPCAAQGGAEGRRDTQEGLCESAQGGGSTLKRRRNNYCLDPL